MSEIIKITSPVEIKNKIHNTSRQQSADSVFNLPGVEDIPKDPIRSKGAGEGDTDSKKELLKYLSKEIYSPLLNGTKVQTDSIEKLIMHAKLLDASSGLLKEDLESNLFILPEELLTELLKAEEGATIFKGDFFDMLRMLTRAGINSDLQDAMISLLKHFECHVNQNNSLDSLLAGGKSLSGLLSKQAGLNLAERIEGLQALIISDKGNYENIIKYLKQELVPLLRKISIGYPPGDKINDGILSIIHYIVRYDKSGMEAVEDAFKRFAAELRPIHAYLTDEDVEQMKEALLKDGEAAKQKENAYTNEEKNIGSLLSRILNKSNSTGISSAAHNLLINIIQSQSPMIPVMHFMLPVKFSNEDTYLEVFIDKEGGRKEGQGDGGNNIFFTIQSDLYGTFEVNILAKSNIVELDIRCPKDLVGPIKEAKSMFRDFVREAGYQLSGCRIGEYTGSKTILEKFPRLAGRKAGIDVRI